MQGQLCFDKFRASISVEKGKRTPVFPYNTIGRLYITYMYVIITNFVLLRRRHNLFTETNAHVAVLQVPSILITCMTEIQNSEVNNV